MNVKQKTMYSTKVGIIFIVTIMLGVVLSSCSGSGGRITSYGLSASDLVISHEKDGPPARPAVFYPGDKIYIRFWLSDYQLDADGNLWIQEDLIMNDPSGVAVLTSPNLLDDRVPQPKDSTSAPVNNIVTLFDTAQPGDYTIQINVRDKIGGGAVYIEAEVTVEKR